MQRGQVYLASLPADWPGPAGLRDEAPWTAATRRILDVAFSLALLLFTLPLTLLLACLVRLDSPGPAFYRQERVGLRNVSTALIQPGLEFRLGWSGRLCGIEVNEAAGSLV